MEDTEIERVSALSCSVQWNYYGVTTCIGYMSPTETAAQMQ